MREINIRCYPSNINVWIDCENYSVDLESQAKLTEEEWREEFNFLSNDEWIEHKQEVNNYVGFMK